MINKQFSSRAGAGASGRDSRDNNQSRDGNRRDAKPFDRDRKPFNRDRRDAKPFNKDRRDAKPFDRDRKPFDRDRKPFDRDRKPFDRDRKPFDRDRKPFDRDRKPFDRDSKPFDRDRKPFDRDSKPFDRDRKPFDRDDKPINRDRNSSFEERRAKQTSFFDENSFEFDRKPVMRSKRSKNSSTPKNQDGTIRLNKFIANSGVCSRREADEYIAAGLVTVNEQVVTQLGVKVDHTDVIRFNGEKLKGEEKVYLLMNKPKDHVTTMSDPNAEKTVMQLIEGKCSQRVFPVGRLDKMTTGVLLLTNDGEMAEKLTHPSNNQKKIYHVFLDKNFSAKDFDVILKGITLEDGEVHADALSYVDGEKSQIGIEIHSGRNRVVRRIFEHLGYKVKKLDSVFFAGLTKKNLKRGQWRFLNDQEIAMLRMGAYE